MKEAWNGFALYGLIHSHPINRTAWRQLNWSAAHLVAKGGVTLVMNSVVARQRAEAIFKKKEKAFVEGQKGMHEYKANIEATKEKTARLRALRLARDEAEAKRASSANQ